MKRTGNGSRMRPHPDRRVVTIGYYSLVSMAEYTPSPAALPAGLNGVP